MTHTAQRRDPRRNAPLLRPSAHPLRRRLCALGAAVALMPALGACASSTATFSSTSTPTNTSTQAPGSPQLCAAVSRLQGAVAAIDGRTPAQFRSSLSRATSDVSAVRQAAGVALQPQLTAVSQSIHAFSTTLNEVSSASGTNLSRVTRAASDLSASVRTLASAVSCPGA